jgi:hypothetical protein
MSISTPESAAAVTTPVNCGAKEVVAQGSILQNSTSAENFSDKFSSSNFGQTSFQNVNLLWIFHTIILDLMYLKAK